MPVMETLPAPQMEISSWPGDDSALSHEVPLVTGAAGSCTVTGPPVATSFTELVIVSCST